MTKTFGRGGVKDFIAMTIKRSPADVNLKLLSIGQKSKRDSKILRIFYPLIDAFRMLMTIKRCNIDVVHINPSLRPTAILRDGFYILILRLLRFRKVIVFFHGWDISLAQKIIRNLLLRTIFRLLLSNTSFIIVLAKQFKDVLIKIGLAD